MILPDPGPLTWFSPPGVSLALCFFLVDFLRPNREIKGDHDEIPDIPEESGDSTGGGFRLTRSARSIAQSADKRRKANQTQSDDQN